MLFRNTSSANAVFRTGFPMVNFGRVGSGTDAIISSDAPRENLKLENAPVFDLSCIFAIFPFNRDQHLRIRYALLAFSAVLMLVFGAISYLHVQNIRQTEQSNTNVLLYTGYAFIDSILIVACIVTPILNRQSIVSILKGFSKVDRIIMHLQPEFEFHENLKRQKIQVSFTLGATVWFIFTYFEASRENVFPSFTYLEFYILPVTWLIIFQIDYLLVHLRTRFTFVNSQLKSLIQETDITSTSDDNARVSTVDTFHLNKLNHIHFTLYEISSEINGTYSAQLLVAIPRVIFFCVLPVHYNIVTALVKNPNDSGTSQVWTHVFTLSYIVLLMSPVIYVVNVASSTVTQAKKINLLIHDLIDEDQEEHVEYELLVFSIQLLHRKINFSVKQFFSLKPSLTTAMFELIITYVIILLQFQDTLASISPIRLLLRPIIRASLVSNTLGDSQWTSELPSNETDFIDYVYNWTVT